MALTDQVAFVTGASRGIGRATAVALARAGAHVAINFRSHGEEAESVAAEVRAAGREALLLPGDVAEYDAVANMVADTVAKFGRLDIAVANAAYSARDLFHKIPLDEFRRTVDVTLWGAFHVLRAATLQMLAQPPRPVVPDPTARNLDDVATRTESGKLLPHQSRGSIVIVSSPHSYIAVPRAMAYNLSKAAIDHMARTAAIELSTERIRVNMVHPGWIDTPGERKFASEETLQSAGSKLPWGRMGQPEEIARGVVFLCEPASEYMTGSAICIDGGISLPWWANRGSAVPE